MSCRRLSEDAVREGGGGRRGNVLLLGFTLTLLIIRSCNYL
jgi:hypothetical protein